MTTIRALLFGDPPATPAGQSTQLMAAQRLSGTGAVPKAGRAAPLGVAKALLGTASGLLEIGLGDVLVGAWRVRSAIKETASASAAQPGPPREVVITAHSFDWEYEIDLDVMVNGAKVGNVVVVAGASFEVVRLKVIVQHGRITNIAAGNAAVELSLGARSEATAGITVPILSRSHDFEVAREVPLSAGGVALAEPAAGAAGPRRTA